MYAIYLLAALGTAAFAAPVKDLPGPPRTGCKDVRIDVKVSSSLTKAFPPDFSLDMLPENPADIPGMIEAVPYINTTAKYTIAGKFCVPPESVRPNGQLQILAHGNTYTKEYWSGAGPYGQDQYSWVKYATNEGYYTLALDLPCNGQSTHGQPITECQVPLDAEAMNAVIQWARGGNLPIDGYVATKPSKVIFVGYSYGSLVANALSATYPDAADAYVLTGFSGSLMVGGLGALLIPAYKPDSPSVPGYVRATNKAGVQQLFFDGNFDSAIADRDYDYRGTIALGETVTATQGQVKAAEYRGAVFVLNGREDEVMCQADPTGPFNGVQGNCDNGFSADVRDLYPRAAAFGYYNAPNTGHSLNLHRSAQTSFKAAHDWMKKHVADGVLMFEKA